MVVSRLLPDGTTRAIHLQLTGAHFARATQYFERRANSARRNSDPLIADLLAKLRDRGFNALSAEERTAYINHCASAGSARHSKRIDTQRVLDEFWREITDACAQLFADLPNFNDAIILFGGGRWKVPKGTRCPWLVVYGDRWRMLCFYSHARATALRDTGHLFGSPLSFIKTWLSRRALVFVVGEFRTYVLHATDIHSHSHWHIRSPCVCVCVRVTCSIVARNCVQCACSYSASQRMCPRRGFACCATRCAITARVAPSQACTFREFSIVILCVTR